MCVERSDPSSSPLPRQKKGKENRHLVCVCVVVFTYTLTKKSVLVDVCVKVSVRCDIPSVCSIDMENGSLFLSLLSLCQLPFIPLCPSSLGLRIAKSIELNGVATEATECPF